MNVIRLTVLGLEAYQNEGAPSHWLLPVCSTNRRDELERLRPNHPNNWVEVDLDGCQTICYNFTRKRITKTLNEGKLPSVWSQFADDLGKGPATVFFREIWIRANNQAARERNRKEARNGGIRIPKRLDFGMSVRNAAPMSIY